MTNFFMYTVNKNKDLYHNLHQLYLNLHQSKIIYITISIIDLMHSKCSHDDQIKQDYINLYKITKKNNLLEKLFSNDPEEFLEYTNIEELIKNKKYVIKKIIKHAQNSQDQKKDKILKPINDNIGTLIEQKFTRDIGLEYIRTSKMLKVKDVTCSYEDMPLNQTMFIKSEKELSQYLDDEGAPCFLKKSSVGNLVKRKVLQAMSNTKNIKLFYNKTVAGLIDLIWKEKFELIYIIHLIIKIFFIDIKAGNILKISGTSLN
eukprot:Mrub_01774.p1 GENE.Mrub_01774~~Mrub_01774.p1  ORF type:complete len:260 (+),score=38.15 Mrub_01774:512-1291(+)